MSKEIKLITQNSLLNTKMHIPVLLKEVIEVLNPRPDEFFIDGTVGGGGHTAAILEKMMPSGRLLAIDWDKNILEETRRKIEAKFQIPNSKFQIFWINGNYADLPEILENYQLPKADGLIIDLGMSSDQLEHSGRGFSFQKNEPLDMRYNQNFQFPISNFQILTAAEVINSFSEKELVDIFWKYGEERYARQIAKNIVEQRRKKPIRTTFELVEIIKKAVPQSYKKGRIHPATRVFQALRIYVNNELGNLEKLLKGLVEILKPGGRAAIISYHSLEDRLVKNYFRELKNQKKAVILTNFGGKILVSRGIGKPIRPTLEEIKNNPRSRSAKLRAIIIK